MRKIFLIMVSVIVCAFAANAQTHTFTGTILDAVNNEPLIGATIMPIGGGQGSAADIDGNFSITVPANVKKAQVSYVGYTTKTVELKNNMTIYLDSSSTNLDDLVVVAYGTATKESLTGSVAVIGAKEIEDRPVTSVTSALEGNAPGVQVNNTVGSPGSTPDIRIRGFNSINGNNDPLYVVDGVPYPGSIADLNPADIESMSVLKDAASAALYGNKGANGVILITTKKAKQAGKVDVTLQIRQGMYTRGMPLYDRLKAADWMQAAYTGYVNGQVSRGNYPDIEAANAFFYNTFIDNYANYNVFGVPQDQLFTPEGKFIGGQPLPGYTDLDWWDAVSVKSGYRQEYNLNAAAATEKFNVFASVGYLKEHGYTLQSDFERYNGRVTANYNPVSYLKFGVNLAATQQEQAFLQNVAGTVQNIFITQSMAPIYPYYQHDEQGNIMYDAMGQPIWNIADYLENTNIGYTARADRSRQSATVIDGSIYGTAVLPYDFEVTVRGTMHRDKSNGYSYMNKEVGSGVAANGSINYQFYDIRQHTFLQELNWGHDYGLNHVDVLLHHENTTADQFINAVRASNQQFSDNYNLSNFTELNNSSGSAQAAVHDESYLGRVRYNYNQKYFGEFSLRRDGTSRFSKKNRWGTFWSVGASWVISKEKFMQNVDWVNYLKLRAAYGSVGNCLSASAYSYWTLYAFDVPYSGLANLVPVQLASDDIRWEATKTFDIALEGSLFNDRFGFSIGYFNKRNSDLLFDVSKPLSSGTMSNAGLAPTVTSNVGTMQNIGWELAFNGDIIRTRDLTWSMSLDATLMKNKVISLPNGGRHIISGNRILKEGKSVYEFFTYPFAGVDQLTGRSLYEINPGSEDFMTWNSSSSTYTFNEQLYNQYIEDARADGTLVEYNGKYYTSNFNHAGRVCAGTSIPTVYGSFGTNLSWKGLTVSALFTYGLGGKTLDSVYAGLLSFGDKPSALASDILNSWTAAPEGMTADSPDRIDTKGTPQINSDLSQYDNGTSTRFLTSSNYIVFKNLNVSYDLPQKWVRPTKLANINLGVSIDNLFTTTARRGMNPQQSYNGSQSTGYVTARVFSFQLSARF
ncbi:MAG: SusC/RagA family TonB-linked outer membrane protein [Muribaculaceae bacterium]|nr:SusC/RagA family TonB-linked outer membrane protein [Muribaculaceae bacterium]